MSVTSNLVKFIRSNRSKSSSPMSIVRRTAGGAFARENPTRVTDDVREMAALEKYNSLSDRDKLKLIFSSNKLQAFSMMLSVSDNPYSVYRDLVDMGRAGIVASYLDIVTNDSTKTSPVHGTRVWVEETKGKNGTDYTKEIEKLFDTVGIEDRIWQWTHEMCHFGDKFLKPSIIKDKGVISVRDDFSPVDVLRVEFDGKLGAFVYTDPDYSLMNQPMYGYGGVEFQQSSVGGPDSFVHFMINNMTTVNKVVVSLPIADIEKEAESGEEDSWKPKFAKSLKEARSRTVQLLQEAHSRSANDPSKLLESLSFFGATLGGSITDPTVNMDEARVVVANRRGRSLLMNSRRDYRLLNMADQAAALARFARAPQLRVFYVDTSGASVVERDEMTRELEERLNRSISFDADAQLYQEQYSPSGFTDDLVLPYSGARGDVRVETHGGDVDVRAMVDLDYFLGRWFAAVHMPKAFMGFEEMLPGFNSDKSLTALDVRYAAVPSKVQTSTIRGLKKMAQVHIKYKYGELLDLKDIHVKMQKGSTAEESELLDNQEKVFALIERKVDLVEKAGGDAKAAMEDLLREAGIFDNDKLEKWMMIRGTK